MKNMELQARSRFSASRTRVVVFSVLIALTLFLSLREFNSFQFGFTPDSVEYTLLTRSLLQGPTFGLGYPPDTPDPTHFPFGYPLLLTPFVLSAPHDFQFPQWLSLLATVTGGGILFWGWRTFAPLYSDRWRFAVTGMFLLAPTTLSETRLILSEPVFTMFVLLALWFAGQALQTPQRTVFWIGLSVASFFMVFTRSVGLVFLAAILFYMVILLRGRVLGGLVRMFAVMGALLVVILAFTPVQLTDLIPSTYLVQFVEYGPLKPVQPWAQSKLRTAPPAPDTAASASANPVETAGSLLDTNFVETHIHQDLRKMYLLSGGGPFEAALARRLNAPWLLMLPGIVSLLLFVLGNVRWFQETRQHLHERMSLFQFAALIYLVVIFFWRGGGDRLFHAVQPQMYLALLLGIVFIVKIIAGLGRRLSPASSPRWLGPIFVGFVGVWLCVAVVRDWTLMSSYAMWGDLHRRTDPIIANTPPDAVLLSDWSALDYVMTGRHTVSFPQNINTPGDLQELVQERHITYIVVAYDASFTHAGIAPYGMRVANAGAALQEMLARGELVRVVADAFPIQVLRVVP